MSSHTHTSYSISVSSLISCSIFSVFSWICFTAYPIHVIQSKVCFSIFSHANPRQIVSTVCTRTDSWLHISSKQDTAQKKPSCTFIHISPFLINSASPAICKACLIVVHPSINTHSIYGVAQG